VVTVNLSDNETIDKALKRFKKKMEKAGVLKEYRNRRFFSKPSVERREEILAAAYKQRLQSKANSI
jgi:small subunit ribosomal protein S21